MHEQRLGDNRAGRQPPESQEKGSQEKPNLLTF